MSELHGDGPRTEYETDAQLWQIEDGERHWYVASDAAEALREHLSLMEPESDEFIVQIVPPEQRVTRTEADGIEEDFPPTFTIDGGDEHHSSTVTSTAAEWVARYQHQMPVQIMSSVF